MSKEILDLEDALERVMGDEELLLELMGDFQAHYIESRQKLAQLSTQKDFAQMKDVIHSMKGAAGNLSIHAMHTCLVMAELLAGERKEGLILGLLEDIDKQFNEFLDFYAKYKQKQKGK
ncbi:MAG: Hpt domain-containing protein [Candidatus Omnitrophica bacterium]|nr:Hpt domain-containing protein [Candidatus Omnitrophota bacterium]